MTFGCSLYPVIVNYIRSESTFQLDVLRRNFSTQAESTGSSDMRITCIIIREYWDHSTLI
jgi:hypothetical protein